MVCNKGEVRCAKSRLLQTLPEREEIIFLHMRQDDVLFVGYPQLIKAVLRGKVCHHMHLIVACIPCDTANRLQRNVGNRVAVDLVFGDIGFYPVGKLLIVRHRFIESGRLIGKRFIGGRGEIGANAGDFFFRKMDHTFFFDVHKLFFHLALHLFSAKRMNENFDARLIEIVPTSIHIVDAHDGL